MISPLVESSPFDRIKLESSLNLRRQCSDFQAISSNSPQALPSSATHLSFSLPLPQASKGIRGGLPWHVSDLGALQIPREASFLRSDRANLPQPHVQCHVGIEVGLLRKVSIKSPKLFQANLGPLTQMHLLSIQLPELVVLRSYRGATDRSLQQKP